MIIYSSHLIFVFCSIMFLASIIGLHRSKNLINVTSNTFLLIACLYSLMATNLFFLILLYIHQNPQYWFIFHFHQFMMMSSRVIFVIVNIKIDYLSLFVVITYPIVLFSLFISSQTLLFIFSKALNEQTDNKYIQRLEIIKKQYSWVNDCRIKIIEESRADAYSFTLFRLGLFHVKKINLVVLTTYLIDSTLR